VAKLGSEKKPICFHAQTERRMGEIAAICEHNGWHFIGKLDPKEPEDIREIEYMLNPGAFKEIPRMRISMNKPIVMREPKPSRNAPCPCGSGKKYKKCCGATR